MTSFQPIDPKSAAAAGMLGQPNAPQQPFPISQPGGLFGTSNNIEAENAFELLLSKVNDDQTNSEQAVKDLIAGRSQNPHDVVMQVVKAELSFQMFMEVRNKLIESYNELSRMQF